MLVLLALACDLPIPGFGDGDGDGGPSFTGGDCAPGTTRIEMNRSISAQISEDNDDLPFCTEYCLWVPEGGSNLDIMISDFDVDLDMYVDTNLGDLHSDDSSLAEWVSNDFGTGPESVSISSPGGRYYIQICSYQGDPSAFTLETDYR
jgi:hypothetical protein